MSENLEKLIDTVCFFCQYADEIALPHELPEARGDLWVAARDMGIQFIEQLRLLKKAIVEKEAEG